MGRRLLEQTKKEIDQSGRSIASGSGVFHSPIAHLQGGMAGFWIRMVVFWITLSYRNPHALNIHARQFISLDNSSGHLEGSNYHDTGRTVSYSVINKVPSICDNAVVLIDCPRYFAMTWRGFSTRQDQEIPVAVFLCKASFGDSACVGAMLPAAAPEQEAPSSNAGPQVDAADEDMSGEVAPSAIPGIWADKSSRDGRTECRTVLNVLTAARQFIDTEDIRGFVSDTEVESLDAALNMFQHMSSYEDLWLEKEAEVLEALKFHLEDIQSLLRTVLDQEQARDRSSTGASSSTTPTTGVFTIWDTAITKKKAWLSCLDAWKNGVEADMIKAASETGQEAPSAVQVSPKIVMNAERVGEYGIHANKELRESIKQKEDLSIWSWNATSGLPRSSAA